jgi:hypothetical protein
MPGLRGITEVATDVLVPGLKYWLPESSSYVLDRKFCTYYPQGSNIYSPNTGTRLIRFVVSDATQFLDLNSIRLAYTLRNKPAATVVDSKPMMPTGHPGLCWFQRLKVYVGGTLIEDIQYYNRVASMMRLMKPPDRLWSESNMLIGQTSDWLPHDGNSGERNWRAGFAAGPRNFRIAANTSQTLITDLWCGLTNSHYLLPGRFPITFELELVGDAGQCCAAGRLAGDPLPAAGSAADQPGVFSQDFEITNARLLVDCVTTDVTIHNELTQSLEQGKPLQMAISSWSTTMHSIVGVGAATNQSWEVMLSRAFNRIRDCYWTLDSDARGNVNTESNWFQSWHGGADKNVFGETHTYNAATGEGFRFEMTCGAKKYPEHPIQSMKEFFYHLTKTLAFGTHNSGCSIVPSEYIGQQFIMSIDTEKMFSGPSGGYVRFTGLDTTAQGDTLRASWQNVHVGADWIPTRLYWTIHYDVVLELRNAGVLCLD